jgi:hypothetical protein
MRTIATGGTSLLRCRWPFSALTALAIGALIWSKREEPSDRVEITFLRWKHPTINGATYPVFSIRNNTAGVISMGSIKFDPSRKDGQPYTFNDGSAGGPATVRPSATGTLSAYSEGNARPRIAYIAILPYEPDELLVAKMRYSGWPQLVRNWMMKKYDPTRKDYVREVPIP